MFGEGIGKDLILKLLGILLLVGLVIPESLIFGMFALTGGEIPDFLLDSGIQALIIMVILILLLIIFITYEKD